MDEKLKQAVIETLDWFIKDAVFRFDTDTGDADLGIDGDYSPELKKAIALLEKLKGE